MVDSFLRAALSTLLATFISEEQYLELDRAAEYKSEYYDGEMFATAGAGVSHIRIVINTGRPCTLSFEAGTARR